MSGPAPKGELTLQTVAMPADTNASGDIFGGWLLAQMDLGSAVLARERAEGRVATVAVEAMSFHRPVHVGDLVSIHSTLVSEGKTSMAIDVDAWVRRVPDGGRLKVTEARFRRRRRHRRQALAAAPRAYRACTSGATATRARPAGSEAELSSGLH